MWPNPQFPVDLDRFLEESLMENFIFWAVLAKKLRENIKRLADTNFVVCGIRTDNHSANINAFSNI